MTAWLWLTLGTCATPCGSVGLALQRQNSANFFEVFGVSTPGPGPQRRYGRQCGGRATGPSCSSASTASVGAGAAAKLPQKTGPVAVDADVAQRCKACRGAAHGRRHLFFMPPGQIGLVSGPRDGCPAENSAPCCGRPAPPSPRSGSGSRLAGDGMRGRAHAGIGGADNSAATSSINAGSIRGSSPCTLTTMSSPCKPSWAQAWPRRSLPLAWSLSVSGACTPCCWQACRMSSSSAATTTRSALLLLRALCHAHHHGQAGNVCQGFVGQARRCQTCRNQHGESRRTAWMRAAGRRGSCLQLLVSQGACLVFSSSTGMPSRTG